MGRITKTHVAVAIVTMEVNLALMGHSVRKYIVLRVRLHTMGEV